MAQAQAFGDMGTDRLTLEAFYYEVMARIEKYETAMADAIEMFKHSTHTCDRDRAIAVLEKALEGTRYDRRSDLRS